MKTIATELQIKLAPHFWPEGIPMEEKNYGMHARMARIRNGLKSWTNRAPNQLSFICQNSSNNSKADRKSTRLNSSHVSESRMPSFS